MFGLTTGQLLGLSVLAAVVSTLGSILGTIIKEFFLARSLERWRESRTLLAVFRKYRDPIILAGDELARRLSDICEDYPPTFLRSEILDVQQVPFEVNSSEDPHFLRYRLVSTVYRLCAFLGWLELYRQDLTFLDTGHHGANSRLQGALDLIRSDLADGQLNEAHDFGAWRDRLIFREEQRAIGEGMITGTVNPRTIIGYKGFVALFDEACQADSPDPRLWWLILARNFFLDLEASMDFRKERLKLMRTHIPDVVAQLRR